MSRSSGTQKMPKSDVLGLSDPFAVLQLGKETRKTHVEMCTLNPVWGDEFEFKVYRDSRQPNLSVEVFDWDIKDNDFLGRFEVPLANLCNKHKEMKVVETWYHLRQKDGSFVWGMKVADQAFADKLYEEKKRLNESKAKPKRRFISKIRDTYREYAT